MVKNYDDVGMKVRLVVFGWDGYLSGLEMEGYLSLGWWWDWWLVGVWLVRDIYI